MGKLITRRILLGSLVFACLLHVWAYFAPQTWYETFPGIGRGWLLRLGPYNEHLVKDMAAMYMAILVVTAAAWRLADSDRYVMTVGAAWFVFSVFHLLYHLQHLSMYSSGERVAIVGLLSSLMLISAALLAPSPARNASQSAAKNVSTMPGRQ
ncbi:hypothetical protein ABZ922_39305 [Streptomyces shenzhenensis]|uniref:hypothetical protein n=1 Tax=Streptomyces shenzhenensis TaxID=943815 RepID=UPI0033C746E6